jgi:hypothetical protein
LSTIGRMFSGMAILEHAVGKAACTDNGALMMKAL